MRRLSNVNRITLINILSTFLLQGISFLTIPIFTRMLGAEQYGAFSIYNSWVVIVTCIMGFNVGSSIGTGRYHFKEKYDAFRSSTLLLGTLLSAVLIFLLLLLIIPFSDMMGQGKLVYILMLITSFSTFVINFAQLTFIYEKKALTNLVVSVLLSLSTVIFSIVLINFFQSNEKYFGRILGYSIPYICMALILWFVLFFRKPTVIKKEFVKYSLLLSIPIVFHALSQNILAQSDRVMMQYMKISEADIGIYSLYYTFSGVMVTILGALNNSWCPFFYDDLEKNDWVSLNKKTKNYVEIFGVLIVGFILLSREVSYLLADNEFWIGIDLIPIITISCFFTFMYQFPVNFEFYQKKTFLIAAGTITAAVLNIALNFIFIPLWGIYGAAFTTAVSYLILFLIHISIVKLNKAWEYRISFKYFVPSVLLVVCSCFAFYLLKDFPEIRWGFGAFLGFVEVYRLYKRKTIF